MIKDLDNFVSNFDTTMNPIFDERNVAAGGIFEAWMRAIVGEIGTDLTQMMRNELTAEIHDYGLGGNIQQPYNAADNEVQHNTNKGLSVRMYNGKFHKDLKG